jgi:hypothetical protein
MAMLAWSQLEVDEARANHDNSKLPIRNKGTKMKQLIGIELLILALVSIITEVSIMELLLKCFETTMACLLIFSLSMLRPSGGPEEFFFSIPFPALAYRRAATFIRSDALWCVWKLISDKINGPL